MSGGPVLRVITRLNIGGPAHQALLLTRELAARYPTTLLAGQPPPEEGELTAPGIQPTRVPLVRPIDPGADLRALAAVRGHIGRVGPAIVHTHMAKAGTVGRLAARSFRHRPRTVHTFHGHVLEGYFGRRTQQAFIGAERALAHATDVLVAVSASTRDDLLGLGIGRPEQWRVVPLGLDLDAHARVAGPSGALRGPLGLGPDVPLVGMVGRLAPIKDPLTMLRAVARLDGVHLAVVGGGELADQVGAWVAELGIADRVHLVGWRRDIPDVMADLDVIAISSRNEGTPVALIEGAACGIPAVATDVGGVATVVADGESGLLVPPGDEVSLADALARLVGDDDLRAVMGRRARAEATRFTAQRLVVDITALYDELTT